MKRLWGTVVSSPKTTFAGIGTIVAVLAGAFGWMSPEQSAAVGFCITAVGLILSGDAVVPPKR